MFRRRALVAMTLIATVVGGAPAAAEPAAPVDTPAPVGAVTLPTGDRVLLTGPGEVIVLPAKGREHVTFLQTTDRQGNVHVVPSDMAPKVAAGEADLRRYTVSASARPVSPPASSTADTVMFQLLDHDGAPARVYALTVYNLDTGESTWLYDDSGTVLTELPAGRYLVVADVATSLPGGGSQRTYFAEPAFVVDGYAELVLDSRRGVPVDVLVDEPDAREGATELAFLATTPQGEAGMKMLGSSGFDNTLLAPSTTTAPEFRFGLQAELAEPDGAGGFVGSPYLYHIRWGADGRVPTDLERSFPDAQLAEVRSAHAAETPGWYGVRDNMVAAPLPFALTEYYTPDVPWSGLFTESIEPGTYERYAAFYATPRVYRAGQVSHERWNTGVFGPAFPDHDPSPENFAPNVSERRADRFEFRIPMFTDQDPYRMGDTGTVGGTTGTTELLRDGAVVRTADYPGGLTATVPPDPATYTLRTTAERPRFRLSTVVSAEWTFPSAHTAEEEPVPLMAVRFAPDLDQRNTAPAGRFQVPVYVQRNGTGVVDRKPSVAVSYDDGATWRQARVLGDRGRWSVLLNHPAGAEFMSLRASVSDGAGSSTTQTVLRAYAIG